MSDLPDSRTDIVTVDAARRAEPVVREPDALALKESDNAHAQAVQKNERGWVGVVMGTKAEKAGNIASVVILFSFIIIAFGFFKVDMKNTGEYDSFLKLVGVFSSIVSGALGYLFGASQKEKP